jgi:hypothetical protein
MVLLICGRLRPIRLPARRGCSRSRRAAAGRPPPPPAGSARRGAGSPGARHGAGRRPRSRGRSRGSCQAGLLGGAPAALTHDQLVLVVTRRPDHDGLQQTDLADRVHQLGQGVLVEDLTRLPRIGTDVPDGSSDSVDAPRLVVEPSGPPSGPSTPAAAWSSLSRPPSAWSSPSRSVRNSGEPSPSAACRPPDSAVCTGGGPEGIRAPSPRPSPRRGCGRCIMLMPLRRL